VYKFVQSGGEHVVLAPLTGDIGEDPGAPPPPRPVWPVGRHRYIATAP